jgi:hypothetical protein
MSALPEPFVPPDLDLRDFPNMPLDVVRLRDSDLAVVASAEAFRAAVLLWCAAWHQMPASSLPDDDRLLANLAGYGRDLKSWKAVRESALRGFIKCDDGRLYHPVIGDMALKAEEKRRGNSRRTAAATVAAAASRKALRERAEQRDDIRNGSGHGPPDAQRNGTQEKRREENGREENKIPDPPPARTGFSGAAYALADRMMDAQGLDKHDTQCMSAAYFAKMWLEGGWDADVIVLTIQQVMAKRTKPPSNFKYYANAIADAHAQLAQPLPVGQATGPPRQSKPSFADLAVQLESRHEPASEHHDTASFTVIDG